MRSLAAVLFLAGASPALAQQGLQGEYWENATIPGAPGVPAGAPTVTRVDPDVNFTDNATAGTNDFNLTNEDNFVARWSGFVQAPVTGSVTFSMLIDDGGRIRVNNTDVATSWIDQGPTTYSGNINLTQGQWYPIEFLFYEKGGGAQARLSWSYTGQADIVIPSASLAVTQPPGTAPVLVTATAGDAQVTLAWTYTGPPTATEFRVYMGTATGVYGGAPVATVTGATLGTVVTGLTNGTTYFFVVRAFAGVESVDSNELSATPQPTVPRIEDSEEGLVDRNCGCGSATAGATGWLLPALLLLLAFRRR